MERKDANRKQQMRGKQEKETGVRRLPPTAEENGRPASSAELGKSYRVHPTPPLAEARVRTTAGTRGEGVTLESSTGGFSTDGTILKLVSHVIKPHMKTTHECMEKCGEFQ